jgi:hypothetical protein
MAFVNAKIPLVQAVTIAEQHANDKADRDDEQD